MAFTAIPQLLQQQAKTRPDAPAHYAKRDGTWQPTTWRAYADEVRRAGKALIALGVQPGGSTAIVGFNRPEWTTFYLGTSSIGAAPVGLYTTNAPNEMQYITDHAEARVALLEDAAQWRKYEQERERMPKLKHVVMMRGVPRINDPMVMSWEEFLARGDKVSDADFDKRINALKPEDLATLIYTSGTTGPPKGVMLSHLNLAWTAGTAMSMVDISPNDCLLSYLPLSHIAEQMFTIHGSLTVGYPVYFAESINKVPDDLKEVRPTLFFGVPRIWEKFHDAISAKMKAATGIKAKLAAWALDVGKQANALKNQGKQPTGLLGLQYALANKLVYSKVKAAVGMDRARICVTGAAPIAPEVLEFFSGLDIVIREVYGQSEDCGPTSFNLPGKTNFHTVGPPIPGVEVKIAEDGEIVVRGNNVFMGYYKEPAATAETLIDGWLHSGDLGEIGPDGFLRITGRKKDIIITAGGKNITPKNIEAALKQSPLINEATVIGDRRKFLSALLTLEPEAAAKFAAENKLDGSSLHTDPKLLEHIQKHIDWVNGQFSRVEGIKKFCVLPRNFTIEDGELTPTLKVKRKIVHQHFAGEIESMYAGDAGD